MENRIIMLIIVIMILYLLLTQKGKQTLKKFTGWMVDDNANME